MALLCKMWERNLDGWIGFWISNKMALGGRYSSNESIYNDFYLHCLIKYKLMLQHCPSGACLSSWQPIFIKLYMTKIIEIINEINRIMKVEWPLATPVTWLPNSYFVWNCLHCVLTLPEIMSVGCWECKSISHSWVMNCEWKNFRIFSW